MSYHRIIVWFEVFKHNVSDNYVNKVIFVHDKVEKSAAFVSSSGDGSV